MLKNVTGFEAVFQSVVLTRPTVVCAFPTLPTRYVIEALHKAIDDGALINCKFYDTDSEYMAMTEAMSSSADGERVFLGTAIQGLLFMDDALFNAAAIGLPIVMAIANNTVNVPINRKSDQSSALPHRDSGWVQLYAQSKQDAVDLFIQAYKIAEKTLLPVMVRLDGHTFYIDPAEVDIPEQALVDSFLPPKTFSEPVKGALTPPFPAMVEPREFVTFRYELHQKSLQALEIIPEIAQEFTKIFKRGSGGLLSTYHLDGAETVVVSKGSLMLAIGEIAEESQKGAQSFGAVGIISFRPFPFSALAEAVNGAKRIIVIERNIAVGIGGILADNVRMALAGREVAQYTVIAGVGGIPVSKAALEGVIALAMEDKLAPLTFLDLD